MRSFLRAEKLYYLSNYLYVHGLEFLGHWVSAFNKVINCCNINCKASIGKNLHISHALGLVIGGKIKVGNNCNLYHNVTLGNNQGHVPVIGDNVTVYPHTIIAGNVTVPDNSTIPAKSTLISKSAKVWDNKTKKLVKNV